MNTNDLLVELNKIYTCIDGPPRAYFELPTEVIQQKVQPESFPLVPALRIVYATVRVAMIGSAELTADVLSQWAYLKLRERLTDEMVEMGLVLFWRSRPALMEFLDKDGRQCTQIRMRLAIPGVDLSDIAIEEGAFPRWL